MATSRKAGTKSTQGGAKARPSPPTAPPGAHPADVSGNEGVPAQPLSAGISVEDLRRSVAERKPSWFVRKDLSAGTPAPRHLLGGDSAGFVRAADAKAPDWERAGALLPGDAALLRRRIEAGLVPQSLAPDAQELLTRTAAADSAATRPGANTSAAPPPAARKTLAKTGKRTTGGPK